MRKTLINKHNIILFLLGILIINVSWAQSEKDWWTAIKNDNVSAVQEMLLMRANTSAFNDIGNPALIQSARDQSWRVFDLLANNPETEIDQANKFDETALMYLAILGQTDRAIKLINQGASVNRLGWTPLHYAASRAQLDTAKMLITHKAIVNAPGTDGTTPLMMAAMSGNQDMVRLLMQNGADPTMINIKGETAADLANSNKHTSLAKLLDDAAKRVADNRSGVVDSPAQVVRELEAKSKQDESNTGRYFDLSRFD